MATQFEIALIANKDSLDSLLRKKHAIRTIGRAMYELLVKAAQEGAGVDEIMLRLPTAVLVNPREFAESICQVAVYRTKMENASAELLGKPQNKSGETQPNGYAKTVGKPQNNLFNSPRPNHTETVGEAFAKRTFEVMQDIHIKDDVFLCYDKTIIAALHTPHGIFLGTNGIKQKPSQHICPRKGQSINQGYEKCVEQCQQPSHAELAALMKYKARVYEPDFENSWMEVYGAKEVCYHCKTTLELVGIQRIILKPLKQLGEIHDYQ